MGEPPQERQPLRDLPTVMREEMNRLKHSNEKLEGRLFKSVGADERECFLFPTPLAYDAEVAPNMRRRVSAFLVVDLGGFQLIQLEFGAQHYSDWYGEVSRSIRDLGKDQGGEHNGFEILPTGPQLNLPRMTITTEGGIIGSADSRPEVRLVEEVDPDVALNIIWQNKERAEEEMVIEARSNKKVELSLKIVDRLKEVLNPPS